MSDGWCGRGDRPRRFTKQPKISFSGPLLKYDHYNNLRFSSLMGKAVSTDIVTRSDPRILYVKKNQLCRISLPEGPQIGHVILWNANNSKEYFSAETTIILQGSHLTKYGRLWSTEPFVQVMATVVADSVPYNTDEDGARLHDIIGPLCDKNVCRLFTGKVNETNSCLQSVAALNKEDENEGPHQGWNIFNCCGFSKESGQYFTKISPSIKGDYIEFIADMDLKVGVGCCSRGDGSKDSGEEIVPAILENVSLKCEVFSAAEF